jgi:hypothetical protein
MKKDDYNTQMPDYIPAGKEYLYPASGGVFCDFVPEGMTALEVRPDEDAPAVSTAPIPDYEAEGQTIAPKVYIHNDTLGEGFGHDPSADCPCGSIESPLEPPTKTKKK